MRTRWATQTDTRSHRSSLEQYAPQVNHSLGVSVSVVVRVYCLALFTLGRHQVRCLERSGSTSSIGVGSCTSRLAVLAVKRGDAVCSIGFVSTHALFDNIEIETYARSFFVVSCWLIILRGQMSL